MSESPVPMGKVWITLECAQEEYDTGDYDYEDLAHISAIRGPEQETNEQKKARLLREAARMIRDGTRLSSPIGSEELRTGLIRIAEALEVE